jgi:hypothetical protein
MAGLASALGRRRRRAAAAPAGNIALTTLRYRRLTNFLLDLPHVLMVDKELTE